MPRTGFRHVALALIVGATLAACGGDDDDAASGDEIEGVETYDGLTNGHTTGPVDYPQSPPVGGDHDPVWQNCGVYRDPVRNENAVHSLEHGAVWISYAEDLPEADIAALEALVGGPEPHPRRALSGPVIADRPHRVGPAAPGRRGRRPAHRAVRRGVPGRLAGAGARFAVRRRARRTDRRVARQRSVDAASAILRVM